ncbi:MAG TPA: hypothetical protein VL383_03360 [Gemmatimonadaceae bacterium]|jgi:hypothetical protein|nr:hypothetical protein [Gemmatimonadaceae bacterium]
MIRSILSLQRRLSARSVVPLFIVIAGVNAPTDPTRRPTGTGYGGVLPVPTPAGPIAATSRIDPLLEPHHDSRIQRGRVLYAPGHEPAAAVAVKAHKAPCPERRLVQGRGQPSPNS